MTGLRPRRTGQSKCRSTSRRTIHPKGNAILHTPRTATTGRRSDKAMGRNPRSKKGEWGMVEGRMQSDHRDGTRQAQNYSSLPRRTCLRTSRYQPDKGTGGQILLVAATSQGGTRIRQRMRPMSTKQSEYPSSESTAKPNYASNRSFTIPDYIYGLYREVTGIGRIRLHPHDHRSRLYKNANRDTLQRDDNSRRSSGAILTADIP